MDLSCFIAGARPVRTLAGGPTVGHALLRRRTRRLPLRLATDIDEEIA